MLAHDPFGSPVDVGAVLRALRQRRGLTQAELARAVGATQGAVARWEAGERAPEAAALHGALLAVGASAEEASDVLQHPHHDGPIFASLDLDGAYLYVRTLPATLREPAMLLHERSLWWRAARGELSEAPLLRAKVDRAVWSGMMGREGDLKPLSHEVGRMARSAEDRARALPARIVLSDVRLRPRAPAEALVADLEAVESGIIASPERAWAMGARAVALAALGEISAVTVAREALRMAGGFRPVESWYRRIDLAEVYLRLGRPETALDTLGDDHLVWAYPAWGYGDAPGGLTTRARALLALRRPPEPELMATLREFAATSGAAFHRRELAALELAILKA